jgi:hypothetical protein
MLNLFASVLLLAQASPDDPPSVTLTLDSAVKGISGYTGRGTPIGDELFLPRLMGDLVGVAPTPAEIQAFAADPDSKKRIKKINQLLEDPRFGPFWADRFATVFFGDLDKVRFQGLGPLGDGVEASILPAFRKWLAMRIQKDKPWTEIVTDLLDARGSTEGDAALAYKLSLYRDPGMEQAFAESVARHFLGIRLTCARCHDHPFDKWRMEDYYGLAAYVSGQRAERVNGVPQIRYAFGGTIEMAGMKVGKAAEVRSTSGMQGPQFLFGGKTEPTEDYMKELARLMTQRPNTQLPRALVNRVWGWLMGWGVVHPVDDFNLKNKALSPALLEAMTRDLIDNGYSLKRLLRAICNSEEYQLPLPAPNQEFVSFRHLAARKFVLGRYDLYVGKPPVRPALSYAFPEAWTPVRPRFGGSGARFMHRIPDPQDKLRNAELLVYEGKESPTPNAAQFLKPKTATSTVQGKLKFELSELTGVTACRVGSDGPISYTMVTARAELPSGSVTTIRLEGPADLVEVLRESFTALLRSAEPR